MDKKKIYYTIYRITNRINDKIYIGAHSTSDPMDNYLGSGTAIASAIKKHGKNNFKKEIISYHETEKLMYLEEARIVDLDFIRRKDTYNMTPGGFKPPSRKGKINSKESNLKRSVTLKKQKRTLSEEHRLSLIACNTGKIVSKLTIEKIRAKRALQVFTKERNQKISIANKGKILPLDLKEKFIAGARTANERKKIKIYCLELDRIFDSVAAGARYVEGKDSNIVAAVKRNGKAYGYTWSFPGDKD